MGEQDVLPETGRIPRERHSRINREPAEGAEQLEVCRSPGQGYEPGSGFHHPQPELAGHIVAEGCCAQFGEREPSAGHDQ